MVLSSLRQLLGLDNIHAIEQEQCLLCCSHPDSQAVMLHCLTLAISRWTLGQWVRVQDFSAERWLSPFGCVYWYCQECCLSQGITLYRDMAAPPFLPPTPSSVSFSLSVSRSLSRALSRACAFTCTHTCSHRREQSSENRRHSDDHFNHWEKGPSPSISIYSALCLLKCNV